MSAERIIHEHLDMSKVSVRWVLKMLTMKAALAEACEQLLARYRSDPKDFMLCLVTCDEPWVHYHYHESKRESMECKHHDSPPPTKFKVLISSKKLMATVFWDSEGVIFIIYLVALQ